MGHGVWQGYAPGPVLETLLHQQTEPLHALSPWLGGTALQPATQQQATQELLIQSARLPGRGVL